MNMITVYIIFKTTFVVQLQVRKSFKQVCFKCFLVFSYEASSVDQFVFFQYQRQCFII